MKKLTIFEEGDKIYFLKEGNKIDVNGTKMTFRFVKDGLVTEVNDDFVTIMSSELETVKFTVESSYIFASEGEAKMKAREINQIYLQEMKDVIRVIEKNYPI